MNIEENAVSNGDGTFDCKLLKDRCVCLSMENMTPRCDKCEVVYVNEWVRKLAVKMAKKIETLELSTQTYNALRRWGIETVGDLYEHSQNGTLEKVRGIGKKGIEEIEHKMSRYLPLITIDNKDGNQ